MVNAFKEALDKGEFAVTFELIPGRGANSPAQEQVLDEARKIHGTGRVHAVSITDSPGGSPALLSDRVAIELLAEGITPIVHMTAKDRNRNQNISQLYALQRAGVENLLLMTGDYQSSGWEGDARPVFDLDSVHMQMLARQMNDGLVVEGRKGPVAEEPCSFFCGSVVNPYKYLEGELVPQYLKMEKKVLAGSRFIVAQLGYDPRKLQEALMYLRKRKLDVPFIANVFVLTRGAARMMRAGRIAGCHVSDELMATLECEAQAPDKGKAARLERAAQMVAIAKGLGCAGAHIGGFGVDAATMVQILDRADEIGSSWRDCVLDQSFGERSGHYLFTQATDACGQVIGLNKDNRSSMREDVSGKKLFDKLELSRFAHYWVLTLGKRFNKLLARFMDRKDAKHGQVRKHGLEHAGKMLIYGCIDCGDCGLESTVYSCPMRACPKGQRNGPCGGSCNGWCEVYPNERWCIWYKAFHRARKHDEMWRLTSFITPPNHWELQGSSPWSNYTHGRDNIARRIPVSLGLGNPVDKSRADGDAR